MILVRPVVPSSIKVANRRATSVRMKSWTFCPCVMPANAAYCRPDEYAGVTHDGDEETRLTVSERERRQRSIAPTGKAAIHIRPMWFRVPCCDHLKACSYKRSEMADS